MRNSKRPESKSSPNRSDLDRLHLIPVREADWVEYEAAALHIMGESDPELRALPQPSMIKEQFDHLFGLMDQFARGEGAPFTPTRILDPRGRSGTEQPLSLHVRFAA